MAKRKPSATLRALMRDQTSDRELASVFEAAVLAADTPTAQRAAAEMAERSQWGIADTRKFQLAPDVLQAWAELRDKRRTSQGLSPSLPGIAVPAYNRAMLSDEQRTPEHRKALKEFQAALSKLEAITEAVRQGDELPQNWQRVSDKAASLANQLLAYNEEDAQTAHDQWQAAYPGAEARAQGQRARQEARSTEARALKERSAADYGRQYASDPALAQYKRELAAANAISLARVLGGKKR